MTDNCNIFNDLGVDSISAVQILAAIEGKYGIKFEDWDLANYDTIGKIRNRIEDGILKRGR